MNIRRYFTKRQSIFMLVALSCPIGLQSMALEEPSILGPNDFAIGRSLIAENPGSLQSVLLDFDVYRRSVEPELADLRVFDPLGKPVPYAIRRRLPEAAPRPESKKIPIFRLGDKVDDPNSRGERIKNDDFRIDAELSPTGAIVSIRRGDEARSFDSPPAGWLLDTSGLDRAITRLDFDLAEGSGEFVSRLRLESSDDLSRFRTVDIELALVRLDQGGYQIEQMSFDIPRTRARYLRLSPIGAAPPADILGVSARLVSSNADRRRFRQEIEGRRDGSESGVVLFDLEASPPIETIRIRLKEMNSIVEGTLESAPDPEGPWHVRQNGVFYLFDRGGPLGNPAVNWNGSRDRYLRLVTSSRGGGLRGPPPTLEVVWQPEQLLYLDRGDGNSTLAIGRAGTVDGSFSALDLLQMGKSATNDPSQITAQLGPERILAGDGVLELRTPTPWRTYGLWALLIAIVGIVLGMSFRLMQSTDD